MNLNTRKIKQALSLASYYVDKIKPVMTAIPNKDDTLLSGSSKVISGLSSLGKDWLNLQPTLHNMASLKGLKKVNLFKPMLALNVPIYEKSIQNHEFSYKESNYDDKFSLFSGTETKSADPEDDPTDLGYYFSSDADVDIFLEMFWKQHGGACSLDLNSIPKLKTLKPSNSPLYGNTLEIIEGLKSEIEFFKEQNVVRTWLFLGLPGLGKTRIACELAKRTGGRLVQIIGKYVHEGQIERIANMKPNIVLFDDIDQMHGEYFLHAFEKMREYNINMLLTSNSINGLSEAVLRPGRIDKIIKFKLPDEADRIKIIEGFRDEYSISDKVNDEMVAKLAKLTDKMSHAYIREIVTRLRYETYEHVTKSIVDIQELLDFKRK